MMPPPVLVALVVTGASYLVSGLALVVLGRARLTGVLGSCSGVLALAAVAAEVTSHAGGARLLVAVAAQVGAVALTTYPELRWHHPVDFLALVLVATAPVLLLAGTWGVPATRWTGDAALTSLVVLVLFLLTWWRLEHPADYDRWAVTWMAFSAGAALLVAGVVTFAVPTSLGATLAVGTFAFIGPALYVGATRPEVVDVRGLVVRFVVLVTAVLTFVALFAAIAAVLEMITGRTPTVGSLAIVGAICAAGFHPLQVALRGVVDELLFGQRPDPLGAASRVAGHLSDDPDLALATIRDALVLPFASLRVDGVELTRSGVPVTHTRTVPLAPGGDTVGELVVGLRPGDLALTRSDEHVLALVTPLLAQTLRARALAADVQASREGTVAALEEERRRLRRDLHDGLGPRLSGIAFTSDAARNTLRSDPDAAGELLASLRAETVAAIKEIRQLVYGMRPPALDELGLVPAVRQQAAGLRTPDGSAFEVTLDTPDLPPLPAAVEVAVYRILVEALTNASRHSGGSSASACLRMDSDILVVEVRDRGTSKDPWVAGIGLSSMRERAEELGGTLTVGQSPEGGFVRALLPLSRDGSGRPRGIVSPW